MARKGSGGLCHLPDCDLPHRARGMCQPHYNAWYVHGDPHKKVYDRLDLPPEERFWRRTEYDPNGCWLWIGRLSRTGYGLITVNRRSVLAHRFSFSLLHGGIPREDENGRRLTLDHLCRVRACVNPDHLELVTDAENNNRGNGACGQYARATHCKWGHELSGDNLYVNPKGRRHCRTCKRESQRAYVQKQT